MKWESVPELRITGDGSHTLYLAGMDEHYHSRYGAIRESMHVFIDAGLNSLSLENISLLEVGFGTGLNALLTATHADTKEIHVSYTTLEKYPLDYSLISRLNYGILSDPGESDLFHAIHQASWEKESAITDWFTLKKCRTDVICDKITGLYDLIYFDAFGPEKQPEMWSGSVIEKIASVTAAGAVFVTYSARGELKRMLQAHGFDVFRLPGPPGKRVITRAVKR